MLPVTGLLLAGGQSSRMGHDKALLHRDHRDMFFYCQDLLESLPLKNIVISRRPAQISYLTAHPVALDCVDSIGPLGGIYSASLATKQPFMMILPIDMPLIQSSDLMRLLTTGMQSHKPVYFAEHFLPLFLPLTPSVRHYLSEVVSGRIARKSIKAMCAHFNGIGLAPLNQSRLLNTNTPQQWQQAKLAIADI